MTHLTIRAMEPEDSWTLSEAFRVIGWSKPQALFDAYRAESEAGVRWVRVVLWEGALAGYVTLLWASDDPLLGSQGIPEIKDLNVLPGFRRRGIGGALLDAAEDAARARGPTVGLRVGLHSGYGAAQRLYARRGYLPDGTGTWRAGRPLEEGAAVHLDDEVTLRLTKRL